MTVISGTISECHMSQYAGVGIVLIISRAGVGNVRFSRAGVGIVSISRAGLGIVRIISRAGGRGGYCHHQQGGYCHQ